MRIAGAFGGAIAFGIGHIDRFRDLQAWKWLFIIEGIPSCLCAFWAYFLFPDFPETSTWLSEKERTLAIGRIHGVSSLGHARISWNDAKATLLDWRLYLHYLTSLFFNCALSCVSFFLPTIISGLGFQGLSAQLFTVPPYAIAFVVMTLVAWQADKRRSRSWAALVCFVLSGVGFVVQGPCFRCRNFRHLVVQNIFCRCSPITRLQSTLCSAMRYGSIHICNKSSSTELVDSKYRWHRRHDASVASQPIVRTSWTTYRYAVTSESPKYRCYTHLHYEGIYIYKPSEAPAYPTGHFTNAGFLLTGAGLTLLLRHIYMRRNCVLRAGERRWQL